MVKERSLEEWIALYEKKTGCKFERAEKYRLFYYPEKGFCEIGVDANNQLVVAYQLCGDGYFWRRILEFLAQSQDFSFCGAICVRHIKPYMRFWGFKIERVEETADGLPRYFAVDKYGKHMTCSPAWRNNDNGEYAYYVTWEV